MSLDKYVHTDRLSGCACRYLLSEYLCPGLLVFAVVCVVVCVLGQWFQITE